MLWVFVTLVTVHGLIHFLGFAKAFGLAELPQLTRPMSRTGGIVWLAAGIAMLATAVTVVVSPRTWWILGLGATLLSQGVIVSSWRDARFGTIANVIVLLGATYGFGSQGPLSLRAEYERRVGEHLARSEATAPVAPAPIGASDLAALPEPVRRYLRGSGAIGRPRARRLRAAWRGRIRATAEEPWMEFTAEQHNFLGPQNAAGHADATTRHARFFLMHATRGGLPVEVFHAFEDGRATMQVRLLAMIPIVDAAGPELTQAEVVTLLNDICMLAPAGLLDPTITLEEVDPHSALAALTVGAHTVRAQLVFDEEGRLVDFVSDDRLRASPDGSSFEPHRWSTPVRDYGDFGGHRAFTRGEGRWHEPPGAFTYIELELLELEIR